ncbi:MAG: alpha/beta hydrolase [Gemmatimonadaceae bacterium]
MSEASDPALHHISVQRTARYFTLGSGDEPPREVWFVCHGYGQLAARFLETFRVLDDGTRLIVAPEGLSRFYTDSSTADGTRPRDVGASWMTREEREREIHDYVRYLDALYVRLFQRLPRAEVRVTALGFSQGVATVARWLSQGAARAEHVVFWAATLPAELPFAAGAALFNGARVSMVLGERDTVIDRTTFDRGHAQLTTHGIPSSRHTFAGGHRLDDDLLRELALVP